MFIVSICRDLNFDDQIEGVLKKNRQENLAPPERPEIKHEAFIFRPLAGTKALNVPSKSRVLTDKLADFASFFLIDAYLRLANCTTKCVVAHCEQYNKVPAHTT